MYSVFQVLSGQYLHGDEDSRLPIRVDVDIVGVSEDCATLSTEVSSSETVKRYTRLSDTPARRTNRFKDSTLQRCLPFTQTTRMKIFGINTK